MRIPEYYNRRMQFVFVVILVILSLCCGFEFDQDFSRIPKKCYHVCREGACQYTGCDGVSCPGGACHFMGTINSSCNGTIDIFNHFIFIVNVVAGGACVFENGRNNSCDGGRYD